MKKQSYLTKSRYLLFFLFAIIVGSGSALADNLTINDGTGTSQYIPVFGNYVDTKNTVSEFIIPAATLENIEGATISGMTFYLSSPQTGAWGSAEFEVYMKEVTATTYSSTSANTEGTNTVVYSGSLDGSQSTMDVTFSNNYTYNGGNLLVGFKVTTSGTWKGTYFYGVSQSYGTYTAFHYATSSQSGKDSFLPKVTFTYTPGAGVVAKPQNVTAGSITATGATIGWDAVDGADSYELSCSTSSTEPAEEGSYTSAITNSYALTGLTGGTTYYVYVRTIKDDKHSKWSAVCSFIPGTLTINNTNTTTNAYVPIYGYDMDSYKVKCQFVIPSSSLTTLDGTQITKLVFYGTDSRSALGSNTFDVYLKEVADATISSLADWSSLDKVYSGTLSVTDNMMTITLSEGFDYSGSNLLIGFIQTGGSSWTNFTWTGVTATGASLSGSSSASQQNFLPQTTFYFTPQSSAPKKPKNFDDSATTTTTATLGWTNGGDETAWQIAYSTDTDFNPDTKGTKVAVDANPYTLTGLTAGTNYYAYVRAKKSEEYSDWSNKADFTTLAAIPVIELSATSHNFGLVSDADAQALTLTITNSGGAALTGLTVTPSAGFAVTDAEGNALTATTIDASSTLTVKVKVSALGQQDGTITIDGNEIDEQKVTVSGYKLDDTKILDTFASASSVSRWAVASGWTFNASTGAYSGTSSRTMTTPKISVSEGNVLALNVKLGWNGGSLIVEGLDANGNTVYDPVTYNSSNGGLNTSSYTLLTINDMPTTVAKVKLTGYYAYINVFNGFTYVNDPILGLYSNEACTTAQASPATKNFGFAAEAQNQVYYIKNTGNGQIDLTIEQADGFTAVVDDAALTEGEKATLTVTMTSTEGLHEGTITVTAKNHDNDAVLGTFVVNANGGITGSKNNVVLTAFPAGWQNNNWAIYSGAARIWSSTPSDLITTTLRVTAGDKLLVEAKKYDNTDDSQLSYSYSSDNGVNWSDPVSLTSSLGTDYKIIAITGIPAGDVLMKFTGTYSYIRQIYGFETVSEPIMEFAAEGTTNSFGMITSKTTSDAYTINNIGTALLDNLSVTCDNANFEIAVADNATSIAAGSNVTFTVALKTTALGSQTGTVTISGDDVADKTFTVKGYVADDTKIFTTFTAKPDRWENSGWTFNENGATAGYSSNATMTSPKIVATTQKLAISAKLQSNSNSYYVKVQGYDTAESDWTYETTLSNDVLNNSSFTVVELNDIPTTVNRIRLVGKYVIVNGLNGLTYDANDPEFGVFSDALFASEITTGSATNNWGFVNEDKTATYYIKNTGTGTMTLSKTDAPAGFTATLGATSLATGESTTLTIAMANDAENNEGYHAGNVVLTAKDNADNTLGTFTVTSSGVVVGSKTDVNFTALSDVPAGWDKGSWSVTANEKVAVGYSSSTMTTGTYTVAAGESMVIKAKKQYNSGTLSYQYTTDGGETWSAAQSITPSSTSYELIAISNIPAGSAKIKFTGTYIDVERIYGYTAVQEPVMTLSPAAVSYDFGMQTAAADYVITVTNSGTAEMTGLKAELTTDDYKAVVSATTLAVNETATVTVTQKFDASKGLASLSDVLTISANDLAGKTINLSGKTRDASKWYVDFASEIPSSFVEKGSWTVSSGAAYSGTSAESSLISQPIDLAAGEKIQFEAKKPSYGSPSLQVRYSVDGGISWSDYVDYTSEISSSAYSSHAIELQNTDAVTAIVEFKGYYYMYIDNVYGGTLNSEAPMIKVTKSAAVVDNGATEAFSSINTQAKATYTITNVGNGTLTIKDPVTKTGAATVTVDKTSLTNGQSATLTITMPIDAPYEYKEGVVTVETSLGNFIINYNATILNPNALDEQFASGKPAGWYFGGYWKVSDAQAMQEDTGTAEDLITEQLAVAGTSDVLTFQAARTSSKSDPTFNVYTSQDRVNWTPVDLGGITLTTSYQDVNISGLAAGDYYVKISGARIKVDNFLGWEKKNNTRDLYVTATSFPATTTKGNSATITATVTSLIAAETGVYAKLFINGVQEGDAAVAQDIALNGTNTFSFTYAIPENKTAQIKVYYSDDTEAFATAVNNMKVSYTFDEAVDPSTIIAGTFNVSMTRTFNVGWNTICLPFTMSAEQMEAAFGAEAKAYAFDNFAGGILSFQKVTALTAATPYLLYLPDAVSSTLAIADAVVSNTAAQTVTKGGVDFVGTYAPIAAPGMEGMWGVTAAGKIGKGNATAFINGFRAYFSGSLAGARMAFFGDDETTGVQELKNSRIEELKSYYDLQGRKVEYLKKGQLYIKNGKKTVIKK